MKESVRDLVTGELSLQYFATRLGDGWKVASIEWVRESAEVTTLKESPFLLNQSTMLPYGLQIAEGGVVRENAVEAAVLLLILGQIIRERRIQEIAVELNRQGYSTREGMPWNAADVFNLLPRLIEAGPTILKSPAWLQRRSTVERKVEKTN